MKRTIAKTTLLTLIAAMLLTFTSCDFILGLLGGGDNESGWAPNKIETNVSSDSLYVSKVENLPRDFIMGMDASCVPSLEASGVKYYDYDGTEKDVYQILAENGINYIRVRVWNDPFDAKGRGYGGGNCDINNAIEIGKRATQYGLKLLVNFHYSDFWADPAKQMVPKAWANMNVDEKSEALYAYTKDCLEKLASEGVDVGMVQIGNETNGAMCGEKNWMNIAQLMNSGSKATREVFPNALVAAHFTNPEIAGRYNNYAYYLASQQVDYDVFASSYYPAWHGTIENLATELNKVAEKYGKKTMIVETAYVNTDEDTDFYGNSGTDGVKAYPFTEQGQANHMRTLIDLAANKMTDCIGVFYWEGTWISVGTSSWEQNSAKWEKYGSGWASSYAGSYDPEDAGQYYGGCSVDNQAFFDKDGKARESLKVFALVRGGNVVENKADAIEDVNLIIDLNGDVVLPDKVNAIMLDNSKKEIDVEWTKMAKIENYVTGPYSAIDFDTMKSGGVAKYDIVGVAGGMEAHCYVSMVEYNFLENWSFDDNEDGAPWVATPVGEISQLYVEDKVGDSLTGTKHYHFWNSGAVEFSLEQSVENLKAGEYKYTISIMGGDGGNTEIYSYVKINGEVVKTADLQITVYNEWHTATITGINVAEGDVVTVGIYVKCSGAGAGAWGKIDDAMLNSVK